MEKEFELGEGGGAPARVAVCQFDLACGCGISAAKLLGLTKRLE